MIEPYWAFVVIYLCGGWVGGIITQTIINELVDRQTRKAIAKVRAELDSLRQRRQRDWVAEQITRSLAGSPRTSPDRAARTPAPASSA